MASAPTPDGGRKRRSARLLRLRHRRLRTLPPRPLSASLALALALALALSLSLAPAPDPPTTRPATVPVLLLLPPADAAAALAVPPPARVRRAGILPPRSATSATPPRGRLRPDARSRSPPRLLAALAAASSPSNDGGGEGGAGTAADRATARVALVSGTAPSGYGRTSPDPEPPWSDVAVQLSRRLPNFGGSTPSGLDRIAASPLEASALRESDLGGYDVVLALGVSTEEEECRFGTALDGAGGTSTIRAVMADPTCGESTRGRRRAGEYGPSPLGDAIANLVPWSSVAAGKRLLDKADALLGRKSSEDYIFAVLFAVHTLVTPLDVVRSDINPSWEKGPVRNALEFKKMVDRCGPQIYRALTDPRTKSAIDLLNSVDLRDQVGSYRVIVSNETPELEEFTLCILQQNNCFGCDSPILDRPAVPLLREWRGEPLTPQAARQILIGHLDHPAANPDCSKREEWSWKIVVGANPAYDAFPMQHQIFYPSGGGKGGGTTSLWYDPVFCVETLDGDRVWCKRHYRCTPRRHWSDGGPPGPTPGAWTLNTLDNGMVSEERWTTVDAADDLSWAVLHYSGAARRAGQSYVGALLCSPDGMWPDGCRDGEGLERIRDAFRRCDLELWELFGGCAERSYMWSDEFTGWAGENPPPLGRIGDMSITAWRKLEREKAMAAKGGGGGA